MERVWQALESRLQQRQAQAPAAVVQPAETITGLRQKSTSAEQSVLDLIAGIGQLFEKPAPRVVHETGKAAPVDARRSRARTGCGGAWPNQQPIAAAHRRGPCTPMPTEAATSNRNRSRRCMSNPNRPRPYIQLRPRRNPKLKLNQTPRPPGTDPSSPFTKPVAQEPEPPCSPGARCGAAPRRPWLWRKPAEPAPKLEDKPPVILFKPKDSGRKWRIPFVSSFLLMAVAIAWLEFM